MRAQSSIPKKLLHSAFSRQSPPEPIDARATLFAISGAEEGSPIGSSVQRIDVRDPREPLKIVVGRIDFTTMFDSEGGEMRIGSQITASAGSIEQAAEHDPVLRSRSDRSDGWLCEPTVHVAQRGVHSSAAFPEFRAAS